ncbi:MAG: cytidine deaminase [Limisphaerales bacterium]
MPLSEGDISETAARAMDFAYAPYSQFKVGAALITNRDEIFAGCNVECISFGLTMCAERVAVGSAIAKGSRDFVLLAIVSDSSEPVVPCGACRQVLAEFNPELRIISATVSGKKAEFHLDSLFPLPTQGILK